MANRVTKKERKCERGRNENGQGLKAKPTLEPFGMNRNFPTEFSSAFPSFHYRERVVVVVDRIDIIYRIVAFPIVGSSHVVVLSCLKLNG